MDQNTNKREEKKDRISALPDPIILQIFSSLDMRQVVQTSILSNRWRYVWLFTYNLNFDIDKRKWMQARGWSEFDSDFWQEKQNAFMDFIDWVLNPGRNSNDIINFNLFPADCFRLDPTRVSTWIIGALGRHAQCIRLDILLQQPFQLRRQPLELPDILFTSNLRVLDLHFHLYSCKIVLPNSLCTAPLMEDLRLRKVVLPHGNADGELILSCPVLQHLEMTECDVNHLKQLVISTPLLESLDCNSLDIHSSSFCKVRVVTPNLKVLKISAHPNGKAGNASASRAHMYAIVDYCLEDLPSLVSARIDINSATEYQPMKQCSKCLIKILPGVYNVQALDLFVFSIQVLKDVLQLLDRLPDLFHNLKCLKVRNVFPTRTVDDAILNLLERLPQIETLVWERYPLVQGWPNSANKEKEQVANLPFLTIFRCLKTCEIRNFTGMEYELKFLEFLLERAILLEELIIKTSRSLLSDEKLTEISEKLLSLPQASSSASVSFQLGRTFSERDDYVEEFCSM